MVHRKQSERVAARSAFTLMEVLVVVAILVALAGVAAFFVLPQLTQNYERTAKLKAMELTKACEAFAADHKDNYPQNLQQLIQKDQFGGPYIKKSSALLDPWGNPFQYDPSGQRNAQHGNIQPDIFTVNPKTGVEIGNWSE